MADPRLVKDEQVILVAAGEPPRPAVPAVAFAMYACPLPMGWTYNQYQAGGVMLPNSVATFQNWQQAVRAPAEYARIPSGLTFLTVAQAIAYLGSASAAIPSDWTPVYTNGGELLAGYNVPSYADQLLPIRYYGAIAHMTFITFPGADGSNGYPASGGPDFIGHFDVPTVDGLVRVTNTYRKDANGLLFPVSGDPLPAYCTRSGGARVVMLAGFPGRAAVAAKLPVYSRDPRIGWDAGSNSHDAFDGDCQTVFAVKQQTAIACGFAPSSRQNDGDWTTLTHAFYFDRAGNGGARWRVIESGLTIVPPRPAGLGDHFTIKRIGGQVSYLVNDQLIHVSNIISAGSIVVGSALYQGGDGIY